MIDFDVDFVVLDLLVVFVCLGGGEVGFEVEEIIVDVGEYVKCRYCDVVVVDEVIVVD